MTIEAVFVGSYRFFLCCWQFHLIIYWVNTKAIHIIVSNYVIVRKFTFTVQPVFNWIYYSEVVLCIGRLISNLITRERKMLFFERCALPWMKVTLAYQDKLTNTLNLKKREKKGRFIFLAKCGGFFFVHILICMSTFCVFMFLWDLNEKRCNFSMELILVQLSNFFTTVVSRFK